MKTVGDRSRFALAFELRPDPDAAAALEPTVSWGALQIWVAGRNLTLGTTTVGHTLDAAEVPLGPILEWLLDVWDPLLHEERMPLQTRSPSAALWRLDSLASLPDGEDELDALLEVRDAWWRCHGLGSALPDFRLPDLHFRRSGEDVELSWDDREWRSVGTGIRLMETHGLARLPALEVASVLHGWATAVATEMMTDEAGREFATEISKRLTKLAQPCSMLERLKCS